MSMNSLIFSNVEPKQFYRKLEELFADLGTAGSTRVFAARFSEEFYKHFVEQLGIRAVIATDLLNDDPEIIFECGAADHSFDKEFITRISNSELPWVGRRNGSLTAIFPVGDYPEILISVYLECDPNTDDSVYCPYIYSLISSLHHALGQHLKRLELQDAFDQARAIQMSLLPPHKIKFGSFEISAVTVPAHSVGGDVFDFQLLNKDLLYIVLGDAAGHGLPAALQARDVIIGLRMGFELEHDIEKITGKLNRIIHRSGLVSRFASLFLATLNSSGQLSYVNAGHPRPLLLDEDGFKEVNSSNMILGPNPDTVYAASHLNLQTASMMLLYTDGLIEHSNIHGSEFGLSGLKQWMLDCKNEDASQALENLFERLHSFGQNRPFRDDASAILHFFSSIIRIYNSETLH